MKKNNFFKIFISVLLFFLNSCSDLKKGLGFEKDVPDEFLIKKLDPLKKPPNSDLLPPDSIKKEIKQSPNKKNLKDIISNSVKKEGTETQADLEKNVSSDLEKQILDQIKNND